MKKGKGLNIIIGVLSVVLIASMVMLFVVYKQYINIEDNQNNIANNNENNEDNIDPNNDDDEDEEKKDDSNNQNQKNENENNNEDNDLIDDSNVSDNDDENNASDANNSSSNNDSNVGNNEDGQNQSGENADNQNDDNVNQDNENNQEDDIVVKDDYVVEARSVYLRADYAARDSVLDEIIELSKTTELNAVVIDVKEGGIINYKTEVEEAKEHGLYTSVYNPTYVINKLHEADIYVIGRIVCFKDNLYAQNYPDRAIKKPDGSILSSDRSAWANPYNEENWDYNIRIALEAVEKGFDEIQFDYVRFPSVSKSSVDYGPADEVAYSRAQAIADFLKAAYEEIHTKRNVNVSADVFAIACISDLDARIIGQRVDWVSMYVDYICPMIYPSHFANNSNGPMGNGVGQTIDDVFFTKPDLYPYEVVYETLEAMTKRLDGLVGLKAKIRPYLQDFTASYLRDGYYQKYEAEELRAQIQAVYDAGYSEWILWDGGGNIFTRGAFLPNE